MCLIPMPAAFTVVQAVNFKHDFQQACQSNPELTTAVFDFRQTTFMDSSGIGALVGCWKVAKKQGIQLILRNVSYQVESILALADLDKLFVIEKPEPLLESPAAPNLATHSPAPAKVALSFEPSFVTHPSVQSKAKRCIDVLGALIGLTITGVLFVPIVLAIKLDSPGPIFFGQVRCSWMGRRFRMWKFRSMVTDAEQKKHLVKNEASGALFKSSNDPRITRVGRFLRKTSLDELPQFWNVLKGEMSLVGTRPPTPDEVERYEIPQWQRLDIKPGMTGEWQVNGRSAVKSFEDVVRLDLRYQENWTLMYDVKLILKTIWVIFDRNSGAM
ncbi:sugar transferase [Leptolyngbya sp. FACHB-36]|uniref:sugar transferase n=1 Tax=Leptolyngbya sp. FACHB-36 TaxID=2692808 RepID=UPI0016800684|nr:sugar transferase [Leptolyngbya sp. FACHB-36]MBD2019889.1 sugar transferase [Leptolyngbya sp. FACHB-36]